MLERPGPSYSDVTTGANTWSSLSRKAGIAPGSKTVHMNRKPQSPIVDWTALPPGLVAITGDEGAGKTRLLRRLGEDPSALWLDLSLPGLDEQSPQQVWDALRQRCPLWDMQLQQDLIEALDLHAHLGKKLSMLSTGSRRKVALVGLLANGAMITCLDQPFAALDASSARVIRDFLADMADHTTRTWVVADYEADARLPWRRQVALQRTSATAR
jgi:ABC-type phosphate/phosphonate transport system ATPase subunit